MLNTYLLLFKVFIVQILLLLVCLLEKMKCGAFFPFESVPTNKLEIARKMENHNYLSIIDMYYILVLHKNKFTLVLIVKINFPARHQE